MSKRISALFMTMMVLSSLLSLARPAAAKPAPTTQLGAPVVHKPLPAPQLAPAQANISCDNSPFGKVLTLGGDREIFAGYLGGYNTPQRGHILYDRLDLSASGELTRSFASTAGDAVLQNAASPAAGTTADVDGDGKVEFVQVFNDKNNRLSSMIYFHDGTTMLRTYNPFNYSELQVATLSRGDNTRQQIVVAGRSPAGSLNVIVIDPLGATLDNIFRSTIDGRNDVRDLRLALGDMDLDGFRDEIAVAFREGSGSAQLLVLTTGSDPDAKDVAGNYFWHMTLLDFERLDTIGTPLSLALAMGDLNGDYRDELIYAQEQHTFDTQGIGSGIVTRAFTYNSKDKQLQPYFPLTASSTATGAPANSYIIRGNESLATSQLTIATGDTDRDGLDELVRAYRQYGAYSGFVVETFDAELGTGWVRRNQYQEDTGPRSGLVSLSLDVGDMDRDAFEDIVAGMQDANRQLNVVRLKDSELPLGGISLAGQLRDGSGGRSYPGGLLLRLGDYEDDSLKAHYGAATGSSLVCKRVVEPQINAAAFVPPFWKAIQGSQPKSANIGESEGKSTSVSNSITTSQSHSVSAYLGVGIDYSVSGIGGIKAGVRATAGYKHATSGTTTTGKTSSEKLTTSRSNTEGNFVLVENSEYYCYSYQMRQSGAAVDGNMRFCEYQGRTVESPSLDTWDAVNGRVNSANASQWVPVSRDWANLALFLTTPAVQSSTAGKAVASLANDGSLETSEKIVAGQEAPVVTRTNSEPAPWWQVDLDTVQPISKLRVWNRSNTSCGGLGCPQRLADFNVFVSSVDPRSISNDPAVLKADPRVKSFFFTGTAAEIATVLTLGDDLEPVTGRFVRVQLANAGVLSLAEVQVFGTNHVEPHRYPVAVYDPTPNDGVFTVELWDPHKQTKVRLQQRGNLVWNGTFSDPSRNLLSNARIAAGGGQLRWSIQEDKQNTTANATSLQTAYRVGLAFDFEAGSIVKVRSGVGYEYESGITEQSVRSVQITEGFEAGGTVTSFPSYVDGKRILWPEHCGYGLQPYYYEVSEISSAGFAHRYLVLDYIVPEGSLDRTANMAACQTKRGNQPTFESNYASGAPGSSFVLTAQNFAPGAPASIDMLSPGQSQFQRVTSQTMDIDGALKFVLAMPSNAAAGDYELRLTSRAVAGGPSVVRELTLRIEPNAQVRPNPPGPGVPVVPAPATRRQLFVPLAAK